MPGNQWLGMARKKLMPQNKPVRALVYRITNTYVPGKNYGNMNIMLYPSR
jgi:hypothetical protein